MSATRDEQVAERMQAQEDADLLRRMHEMHGLVRDARERIGVAMREAAYVLASVPAESGRYTMAADLFAQLRESFQAGVAQGELVVDLRQAQINVIALRADHRMRG